MATILFGVFFVFLLVGLPIAFSIMLGALFGVYFNDLPLMLVPQRMLIASDNFSMLAIPLFILAGDLMNTGGITRRMVDFAYSMVGHIRGGLGMTSISASMIFAGISGSAVADTSAIGSLLIPSMTAKKYQPGFSAALQAAGGTLGPIIPPSILMVLYGSITNVSIGGLFLSGIIPGLLIGLLCMGVTWFFATDKYNPGIQREPWQGFGAILKTFKTALPALLMPIIIIVGIITGVFTATEASAIAVLYAFIVGLVVHKELKFSHLPRILLDSAATTCMIMLIIAAASCFGYLLAWAQFPTAVGEWLQSITSNKYVFLFLLTCFLLLLGMVVEVLAIATIFGPLLSILGAQYGFDPIHYGLIILVIMQIGGITPPVGIILQITCGLAKIGFGPSIKYLVWYILAMLFIIILVVIFPGLATYLPITFLGTTS
jgi:C4-dicarboxylate transporter DctM subunit